MILTYDETPADTVQFARMCAALLQAGVTFTTHRRHGTLEINLTGGY